MTDLPVASLTERAAKAYDEAGGVTHHRDAEAELTHKAGIAAVLRLALTEPPSEAMKDAGVKSAIEEFHAAPDEQPILALRRRISDHSYTAMNLQRLKDEGIEP